MGMAGNGLAQVRNNVGRAFNNVRFVFDRLGCTSNIHLQLHLYDAIVTSTALSSCEVWGVHPAAQQQRSDGWRPYTGATFAAFARCGQRAYGGTDGGAGQDGHRDTVAGAHPALLEQLV